MPITEVYPMIQELNVYLEGWGIDGPPTAAENFSDPSERINDRSEILDL